MRTRAYIVYTDRLGNVKRLPLTKPVFTIGRFSENDLPVVGETVSRHHAEILFEEGAYYLIDKSKSGTFVNGQAVVRQELHNKDRIRLGGDHDHGIQFEDVRATACAEEQGIRSEGAQSSQINAQAELQYLAKFLEVNQALKISLSIDEVLSLIVDAAVEITGAERGALLLPNERGEIEFRMARDRDRRTLSSDRFLISWTAVHQAFQGGRSVIISDFDG
jgi:pSer/pThr/pTyr-binding forkhead associated (FHA) protein